jgi:hypothetical protein
MFVATRCPVGPSTGSELELTGLEMLLELAPLVIGGETVFRGRPGRPAPGQKRLVAAHELLVEDRRVGLGDVQVAVTEESSHDMQRQATVDGLGGKHPSSVRSHCVQRCRCCDCPGPILLRRVRHWDLGVCSVSLLGE